MGKDSYNAYKENSPDFSDNTDDRDAYDAADAFEAGMTPDTPSGLDRPDSFTEARAVIQQFNANDGTLDCMFTLEMSKDDDKIILKAFDPDRIVVTAMTYDTAVALYQALSDHLDTLEADIENVLDRD